MSQQQFDIFFSGQIVDGEDLSEVKIKVGKLFKVDGRKLEKLFSGTETCVKKDVDAETASKYRKTFRNAGALVEIRPTATADITDSEQPAPEENVQPATATSEQPAPTESEQPTAITEAEAQDDDSLSLLPPNTGSLIDCAEEVVPQPIPHTVDLELSSTGTIMDESEPPPPAEIDTSGLSLDPADSGSLEEFKRQPNPSEVPDINFHDQETAEE
jgi:hypothetical protein